MTATVANVRAISRREEPTQSMTIASWNAEQTHVLRTMICPGASDAELSLFGLVCQQTGLNPFARQIYGVQRSGRMTIQVSIDGLRLAAQRSGEYAGQTPAEWCGDDGLWREMWLEQTAPSAARIGIYRKGLDRPTYAVATWQEYAQRGGNGAPMGLWGKMPATMLAKCAEALALRKMFPAELSGVYSADEMAQADNPPPTIEETAAAVQPPKWRQTFDEQWAKGIAIAEEIGATIPQGPSGSSEAASKLLKALANSIALKRESIALDQALADEADDASDEYADGIVAAEDDA